jgi:hypothetical protein
VSGPRSQVMLFPAGKDGSKPLKELEYPCFGSIKYDGSYCLVYGGELYSRRLKKHANKLLKKRFKEILNLSDWVFMGELCSTSLAFNRNQSVLRDETAPLLDLHLYLFDCMSKVEFDSKHCPTPFNQRYQRLMGFTAGEYVTAVDQILLESYNEAQGFYDNVIANGHEGIVTRSLVGKYKFGRLTANDNIMFRHVELERCDAKVLDVVEADRLKAGVENPVLASGLKDRQYKQDNYEPSNTAGSLKVEDQYGRIYYAGFGEGWDNKLKQLVWDNKAVLIGKTVEIEYKVAGIKDVPRQPKVVRFRDDK